jgi:hypothetical protein
MSASVIYSTTPKSSTFLLGFGLRYFFWFYSIFNSDNKLLTEEDFVSSTSRCIEFCLVLMISLSAEACFFWALSYWENSSELLKPVRCLLLLPRLPLLPRPRPLPEEFVASLVFPPE